MLRGFSISVLILSPEEIGFTGIERPDVIVALSQEGVNRRKRLFDHLGNKALIIQAPKVEVPPAAPRCIRWTLKH